MPSLPSEVPAPSAPNRRVPVLPDSVCIASDLAIARDIRDGVEVPVGSSIEATIEGDYLYFKIPGMEDYECALFLREDKDFRGKVEVGDVPRIATFPEGWGQESFEAFSNDIFPNFSDARSRHFLKGGPFIRRWRHNYDAEKERQARAFLEAPGNATKIVVSQGDREITFAKASFDGDQVAWVECDRLVLQRGICNYLSSDFIPRHYASSEGVDYLALRETFSPHAQGGGVATEIVRFMPDFSPEKRTSSMRDVVDPYPRQDGVLLQPLTNYEARQDAYWKGPITPTEYSHYYDTESYPGGFGLHGRLILPLPLLLHTQETSEGVRLVFNGKSIPLPPEGTVLRSNDLRYRVMGEGLELEKDSTFTFNLNRSSHPSRVSKELYGPGHKDRGLFVLCGSAPWGLTSDQLSLESEGGPEFDRIVTTHPAFGVIKIVDADQKEFVYDRVVEGDPDQARSPQITWKIRATQRILKRRGLDLYCDLFLPHQETGSITLDELGAVMGFIRTLVQASTNLADLEVVIRQKYTEFLQRGMS